MRKKSDKERIRIVRLSIKHRTRKVRRSNLIKAKDRFIRQRCLNSYRSIKQAWKEGKVNIQELAGAGRARNKVIVILPEKMNFNKDYDTTAIYINVIRNPTHEDSLAT